MGRILFVLWLVLCIFIYNLNGIEFYIPDSCSTAGNGTSCCRSLRQQCSNTSSATLFTCTKDTNSDVSELIMHRCELTGGIPSELTYVTSLTYLDLSNNELHGELPNNIGNLSLLTHLDLSVNSINGTIPISIENITKLTYLKMSDNKINKINIPQLSKLYNLEHLDFSVNKITDDLENDLGSLENLIYLDLSDNYIESSIPDTLADLRKLEFFSLHNNYIDGELPSFLANFTNLSSVLLDYNEFSGYLPDLYEKIWTVNKLDTLYLGHNDDFYCPVVDYSSYAIYSDYSTAYGSNGTLNCAAAPTPAPTHQTDLSETGLDGVEIALIVLMIIFVLGLVAYCWRERRNPSRYTDLGDDAL